VVPDWPCFQSVERAFWASGDARSASSKKKRLGSTISVKFCARSCERKPEQCNVWLVPVWYAAGGGGDRRCALLRGMTLGQVGVGQGGGRGQRLLQHWSHSSRDPVNVLREMGSRGK